MKQKLDQGASQLSIFDLMKEIAARPGDEEARILGSLNIDVTLCHAVSRSLKAAKLDRNGVAAEMSRLLGVEITKARLDSWSAESKERHRFPLPFLPAFIAATGDNAVLRYICEKAGGYFIESEDALRLELGRIAEQEQDLRARRKAINHFLIKTIKI